MPDHTIEHVIAVRIGQELELDLALQAALGGLLQCADEVCRHPRAGKSMRRRVVHLAAQARHVCDLGAALTASPGRTTP